MDKEAARAAIQAAGWVKVEDIPAEWKDGREVLGAYGGPGNPSSWMEFLTCRDGHWHNRRYAMLRPQFIRLINPPGRRDPVAAHLEAALDRVEKLEAGLGKLIYEITHLCPMGVHGEHRPIITAEALAEARALLESRHDD